MRCLLLFQNHHYFIITLNYNKIIWFAQIQLLVFSLTKVYILTENENSNMQDTNYIQTHSGSMTLKFVF